MSFFNDQLITYMFTPRKIYQENLVQLKPHNPLEVILFGWLCFALYGFINISIVSFLSSGVLNSVFKGEYLLSLSLDYLLRYKLTIYLVSIFIYPISRAFLYLYLSVSLSMFGKQQGEKKYKPNPVCHIFYADFFYLIPFIGGTCRFFAALIYFFQSMKHGGKLSFTEISFVLTAPFLLFMFTGLISVLGLVSLINLISS